LHLFFSQTLDNTKPSSLNNAKPSSPSTTLQQEDLVTNQKRFVRVVYISMLILLVLLALAVVEIIPNVTVHNIVEKYLLFMRISLFAILLLLLVLILYTTLQPLVSGGIVEIVVTMVYSCALSVFLVHMISTLTAIITCIIWSIAIFIVVVLRWKEIVIQMKAIWTAAVLVDGRNKICFFKTLWIHKFLI